MVHMKREVDGVRKLLRHLDFADSAQLFAEFKVCMKSLISWHHCNLVRRLKEADRLSQRWCTMILHDCKVHLEVKKRRKAALPLFFTCTLQLAS